MWQAQVGKIFQYCSQKGIDKMRCVVYWLDEYILVDCMVYVVYYKGNKDYQYLKVVGFLKVCDYFLE